MSNKLNLKTKGNTTVSIDRGLRTYMTSVFSKMFFALCMTGAVSLICSSSPAFINGLMTSGASFLLMFATFGLVFYMSFRINKISEETAHALFWAYSALMGLWLAPIITSFTGESIANCFFMTAAFFGAMSLIGYTTNRDLTSIGNFMFVGLICLIISTLVNAFIIKSGGFQIMLSAITLVIFMGLTAYDIQKVKEIYNSGDIAEIGHKKAIFGALTLYLDFLNMFLAILRLFGDRK